MARLTYRVEKLEALNGSGEKRLVIPFCYYYATDDTKCDCRPYYTSTPFVVGKGMAEFYEEVNGGCKPIPSDAEFVDNYFEKETV